MPSSRVSSAVALMAASLAATATLSSSKLVTFSNVEPRRDSRGDILNARVHGGGVVVGVVGKESKKEYMNWVGGLEWSGGG